MSPWETDDCISKDRNQPFFVFQLDKVVFRGDKVVSTLQHWRGFPGVPSLSVRSTQHAHARPWTTCLSTGFARGQPASRSAGLPTGSPRCTPYGPDAPFGLALRLKKCRGKPKPAPRLPESRPAVPPARSVWPPGAMWRSLNLGGVAPAWGPFAPLRGAIYSPRLVIRGVKSRKTVRENPYSPGRDRGGLWLGCKCLDGKKGGARPRARPGDASGARPRWARSALIYSYLTLEHSQRLCGFRAG